MTHVIPDKSGLLSNCPENWLDGGYERLVAMSWRDCIPPHNGQKLSFVPRLQFEFPSWQRSCNEASRATSGVDPFTDHVDSFLPGYRGGHQMMVLSLFNIPAAGGPELPPRKPTTNS